MLHNITYIYFKVWCMMFNMSTYLVIIVYAPRIPWTGSSCLRLSVCLSSVISLLSSQQQITWYHRPPPLSLNGIIGGTRLINVSLFSSLWCYKRGKEEGGLMTTAGRDLLEDPRIPFAQGTKIRTNLVELWKNVLSSKGIDFKNKVSIYYLYTSHAGVCARRPYLRTESYVEAAVPI